MLRDRVHLELDRREDVVAGGHEPRIIPPLPGGACHRPGSLPELPR